VTSKRGYLVVEGPHDVEFVGRLLKPRGFHRTKVLSALDPYWVRLVPRTFPVDDDDEDLLKRVPVPTFFASDTHSVAVQSAVGDTRLVQTVEESLLLLPGIVADLTGVGILLDADEQRAPAARFATIRAGLTALGLSLPDVAGVVSEGAPQERPVALRKCRYSPTVVGNFAR
jgi:hypothetical protein